MGTPITDAIRKSAKKMETVKGVISLIIILFLAYIFFGPDGKPDKKDASQTQSQTQSQTAPENDASKEGVAFNLTPKQFVANFNKASENKLKASIKQSDNKTAQVSINENLAIVLSLDKSGKIKDATFIGTSDGTQQSGVNIMLGMAYSMAGVKPDWPNTKRGEVLKKLGLGSGEGVPEKSTATVDGVKCTMIFSQQTGLWLVLEPAQ